MLAVAPTRLEASFLAELSPKKSGGLIAMFSIPKFTNLD